MTKGTKVGNCVDLHGIPWHEPIMTVRTGEWGRDAACEHLMEVQSELVRYDAMLWRKVKKEECSCE